MSLRMIRLISGEDIICDILDSPGNQFLIKDALVLIPTPQGTRLIPWPIFAKDNQKISVNEEHVVYVYEPDKELIAAYKEQTTGIVQAPAGSIVGI